MSDERDEILMSQFADGELPSDQANDLLLNVLDDPAGRDRLKQLLRLRQATAEWRRRQPDRPVVTVPSEPRPSGSGPVRPIRSAPPSRSGFGQRLGGLALAACLGGVLVLAGVWSAGWLAGSPRPGSPGQVAHVPVAPPAVARVTPEQMQQVAKVFALHESVAGPLAWYAADDQNIRLASARGAEAGRTPIAVLLKLEPTSPGADPRTLVIVCREGQPAVIELPAEAPSQAGLRVCLTGRAIDGKVQMQYAIALDGDSQQAAQARLSGQRHVGLTETPLGQLALGDRMLNVEAAAWPIRQERNP